MIYFDDIYVFLIMTKRGRDKIEEYLMKGENYYLCLLFGGYMYFFERLFCHHQKGGDCWICSKENLNFDDDK